jgi:hypothetical protein
MKETWKQAAVDAYYELPCLERQDMHDQMVANLKQKIKETRAKFEAANALPELPFDPSSPLYAEVQEFWTKLGSNLAAKLDELDAELHRGGTVARRVGGRGVSDGRAAVR